PKPVTRYIRRIAKTSNGQLITPIFLGALTVLIPCGVTVAMMALAIGSGSPIAGALILAAFVLGTTPVFFTLAYLATKLGERLQANFLKVAGAVILFLGLVSIDGGLVLAGSPVSFSAWQQSVSQTPPPAATSSGQTPSASDSHTLTLTASSYAYSPRVIQAKAGQPYTLVINSEHNTGCGRSLVIPSLNLQKTLPENGPATIDLPAQPAGTLKLTCIMGMYNARIQFN
ncbi:MAG TPA: sulfite exporter TauE/SafE family protein, partial [Candidatus Saccharimonadia bacterium]